MPKIVIERHLTADTPTAVRDLAQELDTIESVPLFHRLPSGAHQAVKQRVGLRNTATNEVVGVVGRRYAVVQPEELYLKTLQGLEARGLNVKSASVYMSDARTKADFTFADLNVSANPKVGDIVSAGVSIITSHDGTTPVRVAFHGKRLACLNGMQRSAGDLVTVRRKHNEASIATLWSALEGFLNEATAQMDAWTGRIKDSQMVTIQSHEADAILTKSGLPSRLQEKVWERLPQEVTEHNGALTRWTLYNAATNVLTHGGYKLSQQALEGHHASANGILDAVVPDMEADHKPRVLVTVPTA